MKYLELSRIISSGYLEGRFFQKSTTYGCGNNAQIEKSECSSRKKVWKFRVSCNKLSETKERRTFDLETMKRVGRIEALAASPWNSKVAITT